MIRLLIVALAVLMSGCAKEPAAYMIAGSEIAITVERIKPNFWTNGWELDLIVRQHPNCQRRYHLKPTANNAVKVDVFSPQRGIFILRQAKRWYVTDLRTCAMDTFKEPPPEPGDLMGTFMEKGGEFRFVESTDKSVRPGAGEAE
ncbi:MAG TPA: hypothetical protein VMC81_09790 [Rhodocyclaceae bacterium]|nr:hypothetical protein [Rhodocyclaceae bacterium]